MVDRTQSFDEFIKKSKTRKFYLLHLCEAFQLNDTLGPLINLNFLSFFLQSTIVLSDLAKTLTYSCVVRYWFLHKISNNPKVNILNNKNIFIRVLKATTKGHLPEGITDDILCTLGIYDEATNFYPVSSSLILQCF